MQNLNQTEINVINPTQQKLEKISKLKNWLNNRYKKFIHDDYDNYDLPTEFYDFWYSLFETDNTHKQLNTRTYKSIIEHIQILTDYLNNQVEYTQPIETKEVIDNTVKSTIPESKGMYAPYYDELDYSPVYNSMSIYSQRIYANILIVAKKVEFSTKRKEIDYCYSHCPCIVSKRVFYECLKELKDNGFIFIKETKLGKSNKITLSDYWRNRKPKTNKLMKHRESKNKTILNDKSYIGK